LALSGGFWRSINALASVRADAAFLVIALRQTGGGIVIRHPPPAKKPSHRQSSGFPLHFRKSRGGLLHILKKIGHFLKLAVFDVAATPRPSPYAWSFQLPRAVNTL
jgi:hypothetical protein